MLGVTQKELQKIDMNLYAALISETDGLDAMGSFHAEYGSIYQRELGRIVFPEIFAKKIKRRGDGNWQAAEEQATKIADKIAVEEGVHAGTLRGIAMRKNYGSVTGEILIAPLVDSHAEKIREAGSWDGAKEFVMMATHRLRGTTIERINQELKDELLGEIEASIEMQKIRSKRKRKR